MANKNRLNPNRKSRPTLKSLQEKGIVHRSMIGLRNIIRAAAGVVEPFGYNIGSLYDFTRNEPSLSNFRSGAYRASGLVGYNGGRAEIYATTSDPYTRMVAVDLSVSFAMNQLATDLLKQPCTKRTDFHPNTQVFGDAVLITDRRYHWVLLKGTSSDDDFMALDVLLTTPRVVSTWWGSTVIIFYEEPNQNDLFTIMLARQ